MYLTFSLWTGPFTIQGCLDIFLLLLPRLKNVFNANREDPDQTPHSAASDLGLHCLPLSLILGARLK